MENNKDRKELEEYLAKAKKGALEKLQIASEQAIKICGKPSNIIILALSTGTQITGFLVDDTQDNIRMICIDSGFTDITFKKENVVNTAIIQFDDKLINEAMNDITVEGEIERIKTGQTGGISND